MRLGADGTVEVALVFGAVGLVAAASPLLLSVVLPALAVGFGLCALQGYEEHARAARGVDYHGRLYNRLWFNDGFHAAHHRAPGADWRGLARDGDPTDIVSGLPPALRWAETVPALANRVAGAALDWLNGSPRTSQSSGATSCARTPPRSPRCCRPPNAHAFGRSR